MGIFCGCMADSGDASVMMIGLDGAGKTTILNYLKGDRDSTTIPTVGFNVDQIRFDGLDMTIWDIGGQHRLRSLWKHYFGEVQAIIFVIDSNDRERIFGKDKDDDNCVKFWIDTLTTIPKLHNCVFLILANKQDQTNALTTNQVIDSLDLCGKLRGKQWHVQPTVAIKADGLDEAFNWLSLTLQKHSK